VPASGDDTSRFARLETTPAGFRLAGGNAAIVAHVFATLQHHRTEDAPEITPEMKTVPLFACGISSETGEYVLVPRGSVTAVPEKAVSRSGKFVKQPGGGATLDSLFLGEGDARDADVWEALRTVCEQTVADPEACRSLSDSVASLVLLRAGIVRDKWGLPNIGAA
jgi:hypothetical protein